MSDSLQFIIYNFFCQTFVFITLLIKLILILGLEGGGDKAVDWGGIGTLLK